MTLELAMKQSEMNSALNFSSTGWIVINGRQAGCFLITTELNPDKPRQHNSLDAVKKATRIYKSDKWEPYERFEVWD